MSTHKNCLENSASDGTSRFGSEIHMSIGRWLAEQYEVPSDIPERLAALLEQLVEPTDNEN